ncbi:WXG100 family type VII secretion target [Saccharothrix coeruleofusca]|uniref:WXG100 family type VII secretion target n=1 Tax=Saccharothrix coeruleofusca TaxID=33919 RepID=A0A918EF53_9PSEU|nr:hypothetical protein [Saccharothrix coeruleofusca]GGP58249.1 hypothetical protein GCM10010185_33380 [Saccharothrix coeruleofusca]
MREDGRRIAAEVEPELAYLSGVSRRLGVRDLVRDCFTPLVGEWNDLHDEAERWRRAGVAAEQVTRDLTGPLGKLDSAWQGRDADSFVEHMRQVGLAGHDMSDAMHAMAEALELTAEGVRGIVADMARLLADAAEVVSGAAALPLDGDRRVVEALEELRDPVEELHESARDVLEAFLRLCEGVSGADGFAAVRMEHRYPERDWEFTEPGTTSPVGVMGVSAQQDAVKGAEEPAVAVAASGGGAAVGGLPGGAGAPSGGSPGAAAGGAAGGAVGGAVGGAGNGVEQAERLQPGGSTAVQEPRHVEAPARPAAATQAAGHTGGMTGGMVGGMGMVGGGVMGAPGGGQQGGDKEHKAKVRVTTTTEDVFGKPKKTVPPVLGED